MRKVAVIGLGRFGMALARHLGPSSVQVIAIDSNRHLINEIKEHVEIAVCLNATDERALASQQIGDVDVCVVCIGENFESALLTTVIVKKLGVPEVICRARTSFHAEIFRQVGADEIIQPETEAGQHLARRLVNPFLEDFITLGEGFTLIELQAPKEFRGRTLREINMRARYGVNLVGIRRAVPTSPDDEAQERQTVITVPAPDDRILDDDVLVVIGSDEALARLPKQ